MDELRLPANLRKGFYDWICQSCVYSYRDVFKDKVHQEIISPIHIGYLCSPTHDFIQNGEAVRVYYNFSANEIYDRFQDTEGFTKEVEDHVTNYANMTSSSTGGPLGYTIGSTDIIEAQRELFNNLFGRKKPEDYDSGMRVDHVMWRSQAKFGMLRIPDIESNIIEYLVDDSFKPLPTDDITWEWRDQIWENYCIDDKYWLGARPLPFQNSEKPFLLYNGRNLLSRHVRPKSIVKRGEAYQKSINIIKYRAEVSLAKNLDKVILFPLGLIPNKEGWDEDKLMYFVRSFSFLFFDETRPNAHILVNAMKDLDMSNLQHIVEAYNLVAIIKNEWDEACGFNKQRKSQIGVSAGKATTEAALETSYVMSEEMFLEYEEFEREEYQALLELSKYAYADGKQAYFTRQDGTVAFLNLHDPTSFSYTDLGVFVKNGSRELQKLEILRNQITPFAQNQVDPKMIAAIIEAENFAKLHDIVDEIDMKLEQRRLQELQVKQQANEIKESTKDKELAFKYYAADLDSYTDLQVALINEGIQISDQMRQLEGSGKSNTEQYSQLRGDQERNAIELLKNATKLKEIASKERMNVRDNETALKNKVVGEK
jgi:hypothetical protein